MAIDTQRSLYGAARPTRPARGEEEQGLDRWTDRLNAARTHRREFESTWRLCQLFVAGKQWVGWNRLERRLVDLLETEKERKREHYTANVIPQFLWTAIGKQSAGDFKPDVLFAREDLGSQEYAAQVEDALDFAWSEEIRADRQLLRAFITRTTYGTAAMWCRYDRNQGKQLGETPWQNGQPLLDPTERTQALDQAVSAGQQLPIMPVREGRIVWERLLPVHLFPPPGIADEDKFPWIILGRPVSLDELGQLYGIEVAERFQGDQLSSFGSTDLESSSADLSAGGDFTSKLRGHVMVYTGYERPSPWWPKGRMVVWADQERLDEDRDLPYEINGERKAGLAFFHYHRVDGRFWSEGIVHPLIDPQRERNRSRSQRIELVKRNLGRVYAYEGTITAENEPTGEPMELIEVRQGFQFPIETNGIPPSGWIENEATIIDNDMTLISGLRDASMGTIPPGAPYAAMALSREEDDRRMGPIMTADREAIRDLTYFTVEAIRTYWPSSKQLLIAGDSPEAMLQVTNFNSTKVPPQYLIRFSRGTPRPQSMAANLQLIMDLFDRSVQSGRPLGIQWLKDSLEAGKPLPLPNDGPALQRSIAERENLALARGVEMPVHVTDDHSAHMDVHQAAMASYQMIPSMQAATGLLQQHMAQHAQGLAMQSQFTAAPQMQGPRGQEANTPQNTLPGLPGTPPGQAPAPTGAPATNGGR